MNWPGSLKIGLPVEGMWLSTRRSFSLLTLPRTEGRNSLCVLKAALSKLKSHALEAGRPDLWFFYNLERAEV